MAPAEWAEMWGKSKGRLFGWTNCPKPWARWFWSYRKEWCGYMPWMLCHPPNLVTWEIVLCVRVKPVTLSSTTWAVSPLMLPRRFHAQKVIQEGELWLVFRCSFPPHYVGHFWWPFSHFLLPEHTILLQSSNIVFFKHYIFIKTGSISAEMVWNCSAKNWNLV